MEQNNLKELEQAKAIELIDSYYNTTIENNLYFLYRLQAIACAIICVNNILDFKNKLMEHSFEKHLFWTRVKNELTKEYAKQEKEDFEYKNLDL